MIPRVLSLAEAIVRKSDREHPADGVLRAELKAQTGLTQEEAAEISRLVFSYYRWIGWVEQEREVPDRMQHVLELARRFERAPQSFEDQELMARAVPGWVQRELPVTPELARSLQSEPQLWLRARPGQGPMLARILGHCRVLGQGPLSDTLAYQGREDLFGTPEFHAGAFELQDLSSQAVGWACAPLAGEVWWDACAGEGGKLLHLSDLMQNKGLIWASDRAEWRLRRLRRRAARAKVFNYRTALWDGAQKLPTKTKFDGVLVDAPCSGIGTWQRNPHARWTLTPEDIDELSRLQIALLKNSASAVKAGGKLIYSVCSLAVSETVKVVEGFEKERPEFKPLKLPNPLSPAAPPAERILLRPEETHGNGMFIAGWVVSRQQQTGPQAH